MGGKRWDGPRKKEPPADDAAGRILPPRPVSTTRLGVAHDVGDHAARFRAALNFNDHTERLVFRWSTRTVGTRARWEMEAAGRVVASGELPGAPAPSEHHFFRIGLADLPRQRLYAIAVEVLSAAGKVLARSNTVRLEWKARGPGPRFGVPVEEVLESVRKRFPVPALGAAVVARDFVQGIAVIGERKWGSGVPALVSDPWHLGSCTKAITATLVGVLIDRGLLRWTDTVADVFPEWADSMNAYFRNVTVVHYLANRSNIVVPEAASAALENPNLGLLQQRREFTRLCVEHPPRQTESFVTYEYQNANFVVPAAMAERSVADAAPRGEWVSNTWEALVEAELFRPLGMTSGGFGPPSDGESPSALWGHDFLEGDGTIVPNNRDNEPGLGPAGRIHASLADWARFIQLHLGSELRGGAVTISADTLDRLHTPFPTLIANDMPYGGGWVIENQYGSPSLFHNGSNHHWYAAVTAYPDLGVAFLGVTNVEGPEGGDGRGWRAVTTTIETLESDYFANRRLHADPLSDRSFARGPD
jgi:CubicO group peptidase (beta-lactamase class C family)